MPKLVVRFLGLIIITLGFAPISRAIADQPERTVEVQCQGRDWLQAKIQIRERQDIFTGMTRYIGFLNQDGSLGKLHYALLYEARIDRKHRHSLSICSISMYLYDDRGEPSAAFFSGGLQPGECVSMDRNSKVVISALPVKSDSEQFQTIDSCQFELLASQSRTSR